MSRFRARLGTSGSYYHAYSRGLDRKVLFRDDRDRNTFLSIVEEVLADTGTSCLAFSLMVNHYHLTLREIETDISQVMHRIGLRYARYANRRHDGRGYVFQGRFGSVLVESEVHLRSLIAYVHLNPVVGGVIADERALRHHPWAGHSALMGTIPRALVDVDRVLTWFGNSREEARKNLSAFMTDLHASKDSRHANNVFSWLRSRPAFMPIERREADALGLRGVAGVLGQSARIDQEMRRRDARTAERLRLRRQGWDLDRLLRRVCELSGVRAAVVRRGSRREPHVRAREITAFFARTVLGASAREVGRLLSVRASSVCRLVERGEQLVEERGPVAATVFGCVGCDEKLSLECANTLQARDC